MTDRPNNPSAQEYGHYAVRGNGFCIDAWGAGPFLIEVNGKRYRFEDSDRFGPTLLTKRGDPCVRQPMEGHPFWRGYTPWRWQGRRVAEDGVTCIFDPLKPTIARRLRGREIEVIDAGDDCPDIAGFVFVSDEEADAMLRAREEG